MPANPLLMNTGSEGVPPCWTLNPFGWAIWPVPPPGPIKPKLKAIKKIKIKLNLRPFPGPSRMVSTVDTTWYGTHFYTWGHFPLTHTERYGYSANLVQLTQTCWQRRKGRVCLEKYRQNWKLVRFCDLLRFCWKRNLGNLSGSLFGKVGHWHLLRKWSESFIVIFQYCQIFQRW